MGLSEVERIEGDMLLIVKEMGWELLTAVLLNAPLQLQ
jgi:hypothetical protein